MQRETRDAETKDDTQIPSRERVCLEDRLHEPDVHQCELSDERDRHRGEQYPILCQFAAQSAILNGGHEVEHDKCSESLKIRKIISDQAIKI